MRIGRGMGLFAAALTMALPGLAFADTPASSAPLPALETRSIGTRPAPKSPQDMLLPGETLRSRWADPNHPQAPGRVVAALPPPVPGKPAAGASAPRLALPPPPGVALAPRPSAVPAKPAAAKPARVKPARGRAVKLDLSPCSGEFHLDGVAVDAMGQPCAAF